MCQLEKCGKLSEIGNRYNSKNWIRNIGKRTQKSGDRSQNTRLRCPPAHNAKTDKQRSGKKMSADTEKKPWKVQRGKRNWNIAL